MNKRAFTFDDSRFPLVIVTSHGAATDEEFEAYLDRMLSYMARGVPNAIIFDARNAKMPEPRQARRQAHWMRDHKAKIREMSKGLAFVIGSPLIRGALKAILWIEPMPQPYLVCETMEEATAWAEGLLSGRPATSR